MYCVIRGYENLQGIDLQQPIIIGEDAHLDSCHVTYIPASSQGDLWYLFLRRSEDTLQSVLLWDDALPNLSAAIPFDNFNADEFLWTCGMNSWRDVGNTNNGRCPTYHSAYTQPPLQCSPRKYVNVHIIINIQSMINCKLYFVCVWCVFVFC